MRRVMSYLGVYKFSIALGTLIKVLASVAELLLPIVLSHILKNVVGSESVTDIVLWGLLMVLLSFLACIMNITANRMAAKISMLFARRVREDLFKKSMELNAKSIDKFTIPSLQSRVTTDTYNVHSFVNMMQRIGIRAPILLLGGVVVTLIMDPFLSLTMIVLLPPIFVTVYFISRRGVPLYVKVQGSVDKMVGVVREDAQGIRVIKALSKNEYENNRFDAVNAGLSQDEKHAGTVTSVVNPAMNLFMNCGIIAVVALAAFRVNGGKSDPETVIAFMQYFTLISNAMMGVSRIFVMYTKCSASARRIAEVLDAQNDLVVDQTLPSTEEPYEIVFDNVSFSYNGVKEQLKNINLKLKKGQKLGIIGATGSGKSTFIKLLMRFYDADDGTIRISGRDIRSYTREELTSLFGVCLQNDFLYSDTVSENISFTREANIDEIMKATQIAQADDFICNFAEGYEHVLTQKATNISGGQKQRLLISRAVLKKPEILILDDSSSALDYKTDAKLREALGREISDSTVITVAQRVSSIKHCDVIMVLEEGEIVSMGDHEYLMTNCPEYKEISDSQMGGAFIE